MKYHLFRYLYGFEEYCRSANIQFRTIHHHEPKVKEEKKDLEESMDLSARHSHSHHTLVSDLPDHSNSHGENIVKEGGSEAAPAGGTSGFFSCFLFFLHVPSSL